MKKHLFILRGLPGNGKTTVAEMLSHGNKNTICTADDFLINENGDYEFTPERSKNAHILNQDKCKKLMEHEQLFIIIANTNTTEYEMQPYIDMGENYEYMIHYIIVENRHNGLSSHEVPISTYNKMFSRFSIQILPKSIEKSVKRIKPINTFYKYIKKYFI